MLIVIDRVGITNWSGRQCKNVAGAKSRAENWQQNVEEQETDCVKEQQNETINHKKLRTVQTKYHKPWIGVPRRSYTN
jgi:hypothetical protein